MAVYVTSDLHGMTVDEFKKLTDLCGFCDNDMLYVLGDVIDRRNDGGIELLCYIMEQKNIEMLLGNHEDILLTCEFALGELSDEDIKNISDREMVILSEYIRNGGEPTLNALNDLGEEKRNEILDFLKGLALYKEVEVNGKSFVLTHSPIENFSPERELSDYKKNELIWHRADFYSVFFEDRFLVCGHTPTLYYGSDNKGKIMHRPSWIDIDTGTAYGNPAAILRLDDMREFYNQKCNV